MLAAGTALAKALEDIAEAALVIVEVGAVADKVVAVVLDGYNNEESVGPVDVIVLVVVISELGVVDCKKDVIVGNEAVVVVAVAVVNCPL